MCKANEMARTAMYLTVVLAIVLKGTLGCTTGQLVGAGVDVVECTVERAAEEARKKGDAATAARLDAIMSEQQDAGAGGSP